MDDAAAALPSASKRAFIDAIADALGEPMLSGWWKAEAVQARQDHLAAVASFTAAALIGALPFRDTPKWDTALRLFSAEMGVLDDAMREYTYQTARDDVLDVVQDALTIAGGAQLAGLLRRMLVRVRGD